MGFCDGKMKSQGYESCVCAQIWKIKTALCALLLVFCVKWRYGNREFLN